MKLADALKRIPPHPGGYTNVSFEDMARLYGIDHYWLDDENARKTWEARTHDHYIIKWYCTDQYVGLSVIMLDNEPILLAYQSARKNDTEYEFVSTEAYYALREVVLSLINPPEVQIPLADLDAELGEDFTINYECQVMQSTGLYNGETVDIIRYHRNYRDGKPEEFLAFHDVPNEPREYLDIPIPADVEQYYGRDNITIRHKDGRIEHVPLETVRFPLDLLPS